MPPPADDRPAVHNAVREWLEAGHASARSSRDVQALYDDARALPVPIAPHLLAPIARTVEANESVMRLWRRMRLLLLPALLAHVVLLVVAVKQGNGLAIGGLQLGLVVACAWQMRRTFAKRDAQLAAADAARPRFEAATAVVRGYFAPARVTPATEAPLSALRRTSTRPREHRSGSRRAAGIRSGADPGDDDPPAAAECGGVS